MKKVSSSIPDWSREVPSKIWDPSRQLLKTIRKYQLVTNLNGFSPSVQRKYWVFMHRFWSVITGAEIDLNCQIGGGLLIPHPNGIVIHPKVKIGPNCLIFQQVTIGSVNSSNPPIIGGHVDIGAGAKVLGDIMLEDNCLVGANAVVLNNVSKGATVAGIPATVVKDKLPT